MRDIEQIIKEVDSTMAMEGMPLSKEDKKRMKDIYHGHTTADETIRELIRKHSSTGKAHDR